MSRPDLTRRAHLAPSPGREPAATGTTAHENGPCRWRSDRPRRATLGDARCKRPSGTEHPRVARASDCTTTRRARRLDRRSRDPLRQPAAVQGRAESDARRAWPVSRGSRYTEGGLRPRREAAPIAGRASSRARAHRIRRWPTHSLRIRPSLRSCRHGSASRGVGVKPMCALRRGCRGLRLRTWGPTSVPATPRATDLSKHRRDIDTRIIGTQSRLGSRRSLPRSNDTECACSRLLAR